MEKTKKLKFLYPSLNLDIPVVYLSCFVVFFNHVHNEHFVFQTGTSVPCYVCRQLGFFYLKVCEIGNYISLKSVKMFCQN